MRAKALMVLVGVLAAGCPGPEPLPDIPACAAGALATQPPVDVLDLAAVGPMGAVEPSSGRVFPSAAAQFFMRPADPRLPDGEPARVPVVAPGRIWLQRARRSSNLNRPDEFSISFRTCAEVEWTLDHVLIPSPKVQALADGPSHTCGSAFDNGEGTSFCEGTSPGIELPAGTELGLAGSASRRSLDVTVLDSRAPVVRFANGHAERFVCPLDVFEAGAGDPLRPLLGTPDGRRRTVQPTCGEYMQDQRGTAAGNWSGAGDPTRVALVHDPVDPSVGVISLNTPFQRWGLWRFTATHSGAVNREPREVTADGTVYCYEGFTAGGMSPAIVLVQGSGTDGLRIEARDGAACGTGPWVFSAPASNGFLR
jgi:hypothetical protein